MATEILTAKEYEVTMNDIDVLMKKGENNLTDEEIKVLRELVLAAREYEKQHLFTKRFLVSKIKYKRA